jgi:hypothetical protein
VLCDTEGTQAELLTKKIMYNTAYVGDFQRAINIDSSVAKAYFDRLCELVFADSIPAYTWGAGVNCDSLTPGAELKKAYIIHDTISVINPTDPAVTKDTVITQNLVEHITVFRFLEEWSFDVNTMAITKKIVGLCPVVEDFDVMTGEFRGYRPLFFVYFADPWNPLKGYTKLKKK